MDKPEFVYVTYISTSPEKVWSALTDPKITPKYWEQANISDWKPGSTWEHRQGGKGGTLLGGGKVVESAPPRRLVITWGNPGDMDHEEKHSRVTFEIEVVHGIVKLTVTHDRLSGSEDLDGAREGWAQVLSSLKTMLETGKALPYLWAVAK